MQSGTGSLKRWAGIALLCAGWQSFGASAQQLPPGPGEWTPFRPGPTEYLGKTYAPSCSRLPGVPSPVPGSSGPADTSTFQFWAKRGSVDKLVVFFEGGGACWDSRTCLGVTPTGRVSPTFTPYSIYQDPRNVGTGPGQYNGVFDLRNEANPFKDWNFVYVPYCTGDLHAGSNVQPVPLPTPAGPVQVPIHHRGHDNFMAALKFMSENFGGPATKQVFVTGASAGGYGAVINMPWIEAAFPGAKMRVLADASQGIATPAWDAVRDEAWNLQLAPWVMGDEPTPVPPSRIFERTFNYFPEARFAQYTTDWDTTQIFFYDLMVDPFTPTPGICTDWNARMRTELTVYQGWNNFRSYAAAGTDHTLTRSAKFYTENSAGGLSFVDWVAAMLLPQAGSQSKATRIWQNASCGANCGAIPPAFCPY